MIQNAFRHTKHSVQTGKDKDTTKWLLQIVITPRVQINKQSLSKQAQLLLYNSRLVWRSFLMLNKKKKNITSAEKSGPALYFILMLFTLCMSVVSVVFLFTFILFLTTGEENIYLRKAAFSFPCRQSDIIDFSFFLTEYFNVS